jgi:hypothetical protein
LTANSLVAGNPKLNLAFVAHLFNTHPGLEPLDEAEAPPQIEDFDAEGEREARVFTLWLNSLDVEPGVYNLFEDLKVNIELLFITLSLADLGLVFRMEPYYYKALIKSFRVQSSGDEYPSPRKDKNYPDSRLSRTPITPLSLQKPTRCTWLEFKARTSWMVPKLWYWV